jgi:tetratricopeptide (TPR) repeat protein
MLDEGTCYLVLLSSKGYFRLDALRNNMPLALIGWTEFEGPSPDAGTELTVIARGPRITLLVNGLWAGEIDDSSIEAGTLGFALASYGAASPFPAEGAYAAEAFLDYLSVDTRPAELEAAGGVWDEGGAEFPGAEQAGEGRARLRLAETFAAMGENTAALGQLKKLPPGARREPRVLLLAARLAQGLGLYDEAEEYVDACLAGVSAGGNGAGGASAGYAGDAGGDAGGDAACLREAVVERAKILYARRRCSELREYAEKALAAGNRSAALAALLGHAHWELGDYGEAALAYDRAFELDGENGLHAANAANMYGALGRKAEALDRSLAAGRAFLRAGNYQDLGVLIPKLLALGPEHWEARALAGKWAFGIENWDEADRELDRAAALGRKARLKAGEKDPALSYLRALLLIRKAKRREALPLLEEAVRLAPDYGLFRFRLA